MDRCRSSNGMSYDIRVNAATSVLGLHRIEDYATLIGSLTIDRVLKNAGRLRSTRVGHVSSTFYGGGVAEILTPLTLLMNTMEIETSWCVLQGTPELFSRTKKIHNALQGAQVELSDYEKAIYEEVIIENALRLHLEAHDAIIVHDPQLPLIHHFQRKRMPWIWQCHIDLSEPNRAAREYPQVRRPMHSGGLFAARLRSEAPHSAAFHFAGDQSILDKES
jgi:trehalose synthase